MSDRQTEQFGERANIQFFHDRGSPHFDGPLGNSECPGAGLVGMPGNDQIERLAIAVVQRPNLLIEAVVLPLLPALLRVKFDRIVNECREHLWIDWSFQELKGSRFHGGDGGRNLRIGRDKDHRHSMVIAHRFVRNIRTVLTVCFEINHHAPRRFLVDVLEKMSW